MRTVVVEDQVLFQEFLVELVGEKLGHEVLGCAGSGPEALELIRETRPNLVILDILIPEMSGILVARTVIEELPSTRILAITSETDIKTVYQIHQLRVPGFVDKNEAGVKVLTEAIQAMEQGRRYVSESLRMTVQRLRADPKSFQKILTRREQQVLMHIGAGLSDLEIGKILGLSDKSVQSHRRNLFRKLDVHSTPELIRFAQEAGFWKPEFRKMGLTDSYHLDE
ncbi:MAG: LuxR C-terminal-related transcriptional regulator [Oceanipulchritudo sp.]